MGGGLNTEVTVFAWSIVTTHVNDVPEQAPLQPPNTAGDMGLAVSVTVVLKGKLVLQVGSQLIPAGELVTVPVPLPLLLTVRSCDPGPLNTAVTACA